MALTKAGAEAIQEQLEDGQEVVAWPSWTTTALIQGGNLEQVFTTAEAAKELGIHPRSVRALAKRRGLGRLLTPKALIFTRAEVDAMKIRQPSGPQPQSM